jgi:hypothetical protein
MEPKKFCLFPDKKDIFKHLAQTWERLAEFRERLEPELELPSSLLHIGGRFQSYAIGNILSAQFYAAALKAHPGDSVRNRER